MRLTVDERPAYRLFQQSSIMRYCWLIVWPSSSIPRRFVTFYVRTGRPMSHQLEERDVDGPVQPSGKQEEDDGQEHSTSYIYKELWHARSFPFVCFFSPLYDSSSFLFIIWFDRGSLATCDAFESQNWLVNSLSLKGNNRKNQFGDNKSTEFWVKVGRNNK